MLMTEKNTRNPKRGTKEMTEFGKVLNRLMVDRELYEWKDLIERLDSVGYEIKQPRLSSYLYGDRNPRAPQKFFDAISRALDLTREEESKLMVAYGFGRGPSTGMDKANYDAISTAENDIKTIGREREGRAGGEPESGRRPDKD